MVNTQTVLIDEVRPMLAWRRHRNPANPRNTWLGRLLRGRRLDHNPLRRGSDRAETAIVGFLLAVFLAGAPFVAHVTASWTYAASTREAQLEQASLYHVPATLLQLVPPWNMTGYGSGTQARWRAPDGQIRTGQVFVPGAAADRTVMIWTDRAGKVTDPPLQHSQVTGRMYLAGVFAVAALAVTLIVIGLTGHQVLDRRRLARWDAEWLTTEPRWSSRR
jgi:hypothetical protein